jgi:NitT/TauT family transport system permease protein
VFAWTIVQITIMLVIEIGLLRPAEQYLFRWRRDVRA